MHVTVLILEYYNKYNNYLKESITALRVPIKRKSKDIISYNYSLN